MKDADGMTTDEILDSITAGQIVYDADGEKVGTVDAVDRAAACMRIETNPFSESALCIPVDLIQTMDPRELFLSRTRDELRRDYGTQTGDGDDR
jgi:hypothetical protein